MVEAKLPRESRWVVQALCLIAAALGVAILIVRSNGLLTESELIRSGIESSAQSSFSARLAAGTAAHNFDSLSWSDQAPVAIQPGKPVNILAGSTVTVTGWAFDSQANAAFAAIGGKVDHSEKTLSAVVHLARPDVATNVHNPNARESGFALNIDTADLPLGRHVIALRALTADRQTAYDLGPAIEINIIDRSASVQRTDSIDALNGIIVNVTASQTAPIAVLRSVGRLNVSGWGFATEGRRLASSATLLVDGTPSGYARYGIPRQDVAQAYHDVRFARTGFDGALQLGTLAPGPHEIKVRFGLSDGTTVPSFTTLRINLQ